MRKYIFLLTLFLLLPLGVLADNVLTFPQAAYFSMTNPVTTITVSAGSAVQSITVGASTIDVTIDAGGSITLTSPEKRLMTDSTGIARVQCGSTDSSIALTSSAVVTVLTDVCTQSGGSGSTGTGSMEVVTPSAPAAAAPTVPVPTMPVTTTGQVTATSGAGGKTTATTVENVSASVEIPIGAVSGSTEIKITPTDKSIILGEFPPPSGKTIIGNYVYDFAATSDNKTVSSFLKPVTFTFTYNEAQVKEFNELSLKIYYWDVSNKQWTGILGSVDTVNNKISIAADHFTYFAVMGEKATTCGITNKTLVKLANQSALYWIYGNQRHLFPHSAVYHSWGLPSNFSTIKTVSVSQLNTCSEGVAVPFRDGSLFRGKTKSLYGKAASAVFLVSGGKLRPIQSSTIYQALFKDLKWKKVIWVPDDLLSKFAYYLGDVISSSAVHSDGSLIQYENSPVVYLIENGKKRPFKSLNALLNNGYKKSSIIIVPKTEKYPDGEAISALNENLVSPKQ